MSLQYMLSLAHISLCLRKYGSFRNNPFEKVGFAQKSEHHSLLDVLNEI